MTFILSLRRTTGSYRSRPVLYILLLTMKWCNKKTVYKLSSFHNEELVDTEHHYRMHKMIKKPKCVVDYNRLMETVNQIAIPVQDLPCCPMCNIMFRKITHAIPLLKAISIIQLYYIISYYYILRCYSFLNCN